MYDVHLSNNAKKTLKKMKKNGSESRQIKTIEEMIKFIEEHGPDIPLANQQHPGWKAEALHCNRKIFSFRIDKGNRFTFELKDDNTIEVLEVKSHYSGLFFAVPPKDIENTYDVLAMIELYYDNAIDFKTLVENAKRKDIKITSEMNEDILNRNPEELIKLVKKIESLDIKPEELKSVSAIKDGIEFQYTRRNYIYSIYTLDHEDVFDVSNFITDFPEEEQVEEDTNTKGPSKK